MEVHWISRQEVWNRRRRASLILAVVSANECAAAGRSHPGAVDCDCSAWPNGLLDGTPCYHRKVTGPLEEMILVYLWRAR